MEGLSLLAYCLGVFSSSHCSFLMGLEFSAFWVSWDGRSAYCEDSEMEGRSFLGLS